MLQVNLHHKASESASMYLDDRVKAALLGQVCCVQSQLAWKSLHVAMEPVTRRCPHVVALGLHVHACVDRPQQAWSDARPSPCWMYLSQYL